MNLFLNAALAAYAEGRVREALEFFVRALDRAREDDDAAGGAVVMTNFGTVLLDIDEFDHALTALEPALVVHREHGDRIGEQRTLLALCGVYSALFRHREAVDCGRRAVRLGETLGDPQGLAAANNQLGNAARRAGLLAEALDRYRAAAAIHRRHGPTGGLAAALNNVGGVSHGLGRLAEAAAALREALPLHRAAHDVAGRVSAHNTLAWVLRDLGEPEQALLELREAEQLARESGDPLLVGAVAQHLGGVYLAVGRVDDAVEELRTADRMAGSSGSVWAVGAAANSLGRALLAAGDTAAAVEATRRAAELAAEVDIPAAEAVARLNVALAELQDGDPDAAALAVGRAMGLAVTVDDRYTQAAAIAVGGRVASARGDPVQAADLLSAAVQRFEQLGSDLGAAVARADLAEAYRDLGRIDDAVAAFERAISTVESVRAGVLDEDVRATFLSSAADVPQRYARLLVAVNRPADALRVVEQARARVLTDRMAQLNGPGRDLDPRTAARRVELHAELLAAERELEKLLRVRHVDPAEVAAVRDRRRASVLALRTITTALRSARPRLAELLYPQVPDLAEVRRRVLGEAVLMEYVLGERESLLIAATADAVEAHVLPTRAEIERRVIELRAAVIAYRPSYAHGHELYRMLIAPADALIGDRDLVVVADGVLNDLPFGLLLTREVADGAWEYRSLPYLIRDRSISMLPSITVAGLMKDRSPTDFDHQLVAFADPQSPGADRLPFTRREVWRIAGLLDPDLPQDRPERYDGSTTLIRTGPAATKSEIMRLTAGPSAVSCRYLHLATHGLLDPVRPEYSGLMFSAGDERAGSDGTWRGYEVLEAALPGTVVVLSACETALGRTLAGEGVQGLSRSFLYAGAAAVVASLWRVPDAATARFMVHLYRYLRDGEPPASALRQAQLAMLDAAAAHPRLWVGFTVTGIASDEAARLPD